MLQNGDGTAVITMTEIEHGTTVCRCRGELKVKVAIDEPTGREVLLGGGDILLGVVAVVVLVVLVVCPCPLFSSSLFFLFFSPLLSVPPLFRLVGLLK